MTTDDDNQSSDSDDANQVSMTFQVAHTTTGMVSLSVMCAGLLSNVLMFPSGARELGQKLVLASDMLEENRPSALQIVKGNN